MTKSSVASDSLVDTVDKLPFDVAVLFDNHLAYTVAVVDHEWFV